MAVRAESFVETLTAHAAVVSLHLSSVPPERFREVVVRDRFGSRLDVRSPKDCVSDWWAVTPTVAREAFPLSVETAGCDGAADTPAAFNGPIQPGLLTLPGTGGEPTPTCLVACEDNKGCNRAIWAGYLAQSELEPACEEWRRTRDRADERDREASTMHVTAITLFIAGVAMAFAAGGIVPWGWLVGLIGLALMGAAVALLLAAEDARREALALRRRQLELEGPLAALRVRLEAAIAAIQRSCCLSGCGIALPQMPC